MAILPCAGPPAGGTASLAQEAVTASKRNSYNVPPHCLRVVGSATPNNALPLCLRAVGSGTRATQCLTVWGQWAVELVLCTATPPGGSGLGILAKHYHTAWWRWAVQIL